MQRHRTLVCLAAASAALTATAVARANASATYPRRQVAYLIHHGVLRSKTPHAFHPEKPLAPYLLDRMLSAIPGAQWVEFDEATHALPAEYPEDISEHIAAFLTAIAKKT